MTTDIEINSVSVSLIAKNIARIVKLNDYDVIIKPNEHILIVPHINQVAMVAKVANTLCEENINIGSMNVSQNIKGSDMSIMAIDIDTALSEEMLNKISKIEGVHNPKCIKLNV